ncbi:lysozyme [Pseudoxanthomonas dokdonensis]|uniref:lysozyme n=1 Tax=Pseudoxanthomonas dokdonensis TaxID=344882 RepID=UPI001FDF0C7F|nr:lysozyme [Pseudoxanthomonas dokdonensis]
MKSTKPVIGLSAAAVLAAAVAIIAPWEGTRYTPYQDVVGVWTVCEGITGDAVVQGKTYTRAECDSLLAREVTNTYTGLQICIGQPLALNQWAALISWAYNVGVHAACNSTLVRQLNAGYPPSQWCRQLLRWSYAGGRQVKGLVRRRQAEYAQCIE